MRTSYYKKLDTASLAVLDLTPYQHNGQPGYLLTRINVPVQHRGLGYGTMLLLECLQSADAEGAVIVLEISPSDGLNFEELGAWYTRYGFIRQEDQNVWVRYAFKN
jgi:ribosomal protein S18 acetylase RimI-like enzyme